MIEDPKTFAEALGNLGEAVDEFKAAVTEAAHKDFPTFIKWLRAVAKWLARMLP